MPLSLDPHFHWDGTTSDLAQQWFARYLANQTAPKLTLKTPNLPTDIQSRLTTAKATFEDLPGLLQRAVVWDSGYVINELNQLVRVQTLNGVSMAEIAVPLNDYLSIAQCKTQNCTQLDTTAWYKNIDCTGTNMLKATRCLVENFNSAGNPDLSMWSTGGTDDIIPEMLLLRHTWSDPQTPTTKYEVAAIHTAPIGASGSSDAFEPGYGKCSTSVNRPQASFVGSLVIPCGTMTTISPSMKSQMKPTTPSTMVTTWLHEYMTNTTSTTPPATSGVDIMVILIPAIIIGLLLFVVVVWYCRRRRRTNSYDLGTPVAGVNHASFTSPGYQLEIKVNQSSAHASTATTSTESIHQMTDHTEDLAYNTAFNLLRGDPSVAEKKIGNHDIELAVQLAKGAYGEVWVGYYKHETVAIKRLLRTKYQSANDVEAFVLEIQLSAKLHHPNIVRFIGAAWDSIDALAMVMEYLPAGDLSKVLRTSGVTLTWEQHKLVMARGLFSAVAYLHDQTPAIIHRDIKSKNVLLSDTLEPKLIDFGVSRRKMDETMTAGVGTPFWTAPEVLNSERYTEKSDIYSLGVLLTELDTHQIPYNNIVGEDGGMMHLKILNDVVAGKLRPSVTETCPETIRRIIVCCLRQNPATRPTAQEVLWMLA